MTFFDRNDPNNMYSDLEKTRTCFNCTLGIAVTDGTRPLHLQAGNIMIVKCNLSGEYSSVASPCSKWQGDKALPQLKEWQKEMDIDVPAGYSKDAKQCRYSAALAANKELKTDKTFMELEAARDALPKITSEEYRRLIQNNRY